MLVVVGMLDAVVGILDLVVGLSDVMLMLEAVVWLVRGGLLPSRTAQYGACTGCSSPSSGTAAWVTSDVVDHSMYCTLFTSSVLISTAHIAGRGRQEAAD